MVFYGRGFHDVNISDMRIECEKEIDDWDGLSERQCKGGSKSNE